MGGFSVEEVSRAVEAAQPDALALACATVGLDRGAFSTLLSLVRELSGGSPGGDANPGAPRVFDARWTGTGGHKRKDAFVKAVAAAV